MNISVYIIYRRRRIKSEMINTNVQRQNTEAWKLAKTLIIMVVVLAVALLPGFIFSILSISTTNIQEIKFIMFVTLITNSAVNSWIYIYRYSSNKTISN